MSGNACASVLSHLWWGTETERKIALAAIVAQPLTNNPGCEVVAVNSMWITGTITAKQKVRQKVPGLDAVCR